MFYHVQFIHLSIFQTVRSIGCLIYVHIKTFFFGKDLLTDPCGFGSIQCLCLPALFSWWTLIMNSNLKWWWPGLTDSTCFWNTPISAASTALPVQHQTYGLMEMKRELTRNWKFCLHLLTLIWKLISATD